MNEPDNVPEKPGVWRILRILLPLLFLFTGFFGVQIWMIWDEENTVKPEQDVSMSVAANSAKADLAKLTEAGSGAPKAVNIKNEQPAVVKEQAIAADIPGLEYFRLQVGSFENPSGAEKLKNKLKDMGYGSLIIKEGQLSEVATMYFFSRDQAENLQGRMASQAVSGFPEKVVISPRMVMLKGDSHRLQDFMDGTLIEIPEMLRELCDFYYIYESQGMDVKAHETLILKQVASVSDMKTAVENMQSGLEDQELQTQLKDYLSAYVQYLEKVKKVKSFDRQLLWPGLMDRIEAFGRIGEQKSVN